MVVKVSELDMRPGDPDRLTPYVRDLLVRQAELQAAIQQRRANFAARNPHYQRMKAAHAAYRTFMAEAERLKRLRENSAGQQRVQAAEDLRRMKNRQTDIQNEYETARRLYDAWKAANPADREPALLSLQEDLEAVRNALAGRGPSSS